MVFVSLEDETGMSNIIIWPRVFERYRRVAAGAAMLLVRGRLEKSGLVANVIASDLRPLTLSDRPIRAPSRDFH